MKLINKFNIFKDHQPNYQKGITLLEILAVLVIIALVFIALSRNFGFGTDKAKTTDVQQAFKPYQIGFEGMVNEYSGIPTTSGTTVDYGTLNRYLGKDYQLMDTTNGGTNPPKDTKLLDPWNVPYKIQAKYVNGAESIVVVRSAGKDKKSDSSTDLFSVDTTNDKDDLALVTHYKNGKVKSCTNGFEKEVGSIAKTMKSVTYSPTKTFHYLYGVFRSAHTTPPFATIQSKQPLYPFEYRINNSDDWGERYLTYIFSNNQLNLVWDGADGGTIRDTEGKSFDILYSWGAWQTGKTSLDYTFLNYIEEGYSTVIDSGGMLFSGCQ